MTDEQRQRLRDLMANAVPGQAIRIPADIMASINDSLAELDASFRQDILNIRAREHIARHIPVPYFLRDGFQGGSYDD